MDRWAGRVALVTGASAGIGASIVRRLVAEGMRVVGAARSVDRVQAIADELKGQPGSLLPIKCDLTKDDQVLAMFARIKQELGGVDVCINNAGMSINSSLQEGTPDQWRKMLDLNVVALCLCTREALASMKERGVDDGHIIHINSMGGHRIANLPGIHFYAGTKHMVTALTEALRQELRQTNTNIRISAISPGMVETEFAERAGMSKAAAHQMYTQNACMQADDITESVIHALSAPRRVQIHDILIHPTQSQI
ncbi:dehydrogenase/reductase SDR family member 11-like [Portunus trituberculatus]|uniref:dehydrogenase/reductase SDR family member 11-like n=1 Tax=Portunus trituberculatus TaxID=210409 RepID=UPI001E1D04E4|nr:dehydrogenase/reductase SDR family member 11-like [Portunus trituberculatus]XP_045130203.1 dehydrogenase/reductase SDR family member 11-like [Portunus trituberculatus]